MQKGFTTALLLIGILIVVGLVGGVYYLGILKNSNKPAKQVQNTVISSALVNASPQLASAAGSAATSWNTYTNSVYGYSISYPNGWSVISGINCQLNTYVATAQDSVICLTPQPIPLTADQASGKDFKGAIDAQNKLQAISIRISIKPFGITSHDYFKQYIVASAQAHGAILPNEITPPFKSDNPALDITIEGTSAYITKSSQDSILITLGAQKIDPQLVYKIFSTFKYTNDSLVTLGNDDFAAIQQALAKYDKRPISQLDTTVRKAPALYNGLYAMGGDYGVGTAGGGIWIAAKVNGQWKIVYAGNGGPQCEDVKQYNLPKDLDLCN